MVYIINFQNSQLLQLEVFENYGVADVPIVNSQIVFDRLPIHFVANPSRQDPKSYSMVIASPSLATEGK